MVAIKQVICAETELTAEQLKLLDYLGDITHELSEIAMAGGFVKVSELLMEARTEVKAIC